MVQKTGSGIGNGKNPVFLAEINSGNRPYRRFFIRLLAQKLLKSYVPINAFDASFIFPHRAVLPENTRISARKHAFCHRSRYGIRMFVHRIQTAVEALRHPREAGDFDVFRQIMIDCLQKFFIG